MSNFKLPSGLEGTDKLPRTRAELRNMFQTESGLNISRPGITEIATVGGVSRGGFEWNGSLYYVYSTELRKITDRETGTSSLVGTIAGSEEIDSAAGDNQIAIIVKGGKSYTLDKSDNLVDTSGNANFAPFSSVTHIKSRFVYVLNDGTVFKFSDVGAAGTIQPLSFLKSVINAKVAFELKGYLYIMGSDSTIKYKDTGASPTPYREVGDFNIGFIGGLVQGTNTYLFVGRERNQSPGIFAISFQGWQKISNEAVDLIITTYTELELSQTIPGRINWLSSYDFATFELRRDSLLFFQGRWSATDTVVDNVSRPWLGGYIVEIGNEYFSGSDDKLGKFADTNFDYGNRITRIQRGAVNPNRNQDFTVASLELGVSQGFNNNEVQSVGLRTSNNGVTFGNTVYKKLGLAGQYSKKLIWHGLGGYQGFMTYELVTDQNVTFNSDYLDIEQGV